MDLNRTLSLIGIDNLKKIRNLNILIIGLGGVGGYTLESLVRLGVNNITIIDGDKVEESNINRQIICDINTIGEYKTEAWYRRIMNINSKAQIKLITKHLTDEDINKLNYCYDYIIDACDTVKVKIELIKHCIEKKQKLISCMGTARKIDATKIKIGKLSETYNCPLARKIRNELKKENINLNKINVVYSTEIPFETENTHASISYVPAVAGLFITNYIVNDVLINK